MAKSTKDTDTLDPNIATQTTGNPEGEAKADADKQAANASVDNPGHPGVVGTRDDKADRTEIDKAKVKDKDTLIDGRDKVTAEGTPNVNLTELEGRGGKPVVNTPPTFEGAGKGDPRYIQGSDHVDQIGRALTAEELMKAPPVSDKKDIIGLMSTDPTKATPVELKPEMVKGTYHFESNAGARVLSTRHVTEGHTNPLDILADLVRDNATLEKDQFNNYVVKMGDMPIGKLVKLAD